MKRILLLVLFVVPLDAFAYIGPGLGIGTIGVVFGVLFSIIMAFFAIIWYPIKRLLKKFKTNRKN
jgi:hypothetical protein